MRARLPIFAVAVSLVGLTGCEFDLGDVGNWQRYNRDFHYSYPLNAGGRVSVESFNGSIEVSAWDQSTVDVSGTKYGPTQDAADALRIAAENSPGAVSVRAVHPVERRHNQGAKFVLKVPRTAIIERLATSNGGIRTVDGLGPARMRTSNGSIRVEALKGGLDAGTSNGGIDLIAVESDVTAHTSNGHIHAERLRGSLDASTSNGGISAGIERAGREIRAGTSNGSVDLHLPEGLTQDVHAHTSNGGITLHLPGKLNARVEAATTNSSIHSEFDLTVRGEMSRNRVEGEIGTGGPLLELTTSNGAIRLLKM